MHSTRIIVALVDKRFDMWLPVFDSTARRARAYLLNFVYFLLSSLKSYDAATAVALVEYKGDELDIDSSLLTDFQFRTDSLYEFIGEIQARIGEERGPGRGGRGERERCGCACIVTSSVVGLALPYDQSRTWIIPVQSNKWFAALATTAVKHSSICLRPPNLNRRIPPPSLPALVHNNENTLGRAREKESQGARVPQS